MPISATVALEISLLIIEKERGLLPTSMLVSATPALNNSLSAIEKMNGFLLASVLISGSAVVSTDPTAIEILFRVHENHIRLCAPAI